MRFSASTCRMRQHMSACVSMRQKHARYLSDLEDHTRVGFVGIIAVRQRNDRARLLHAHLCMWPSATGVCGLQILVYAVLAVRQRNDRARLLHAHLRMRPEATSVCSLNYWGNPHRY